MSCPNCRSEHKIYDENLEKKVFDNRKLLIGINFDNKEIEITYDDKVLIKTYELLLCDYFKKFENFFNNNNLIKELFLSNALFFFCFCN